MSRYHNRYAYDRGCRCEECRADKAAHAAALREKRRGTPPPVHGTPSSYVNWCCRCEACKAANAAYRRQWNARVSPVPVGGV